MFTESLHDLLSRSVWIDVCGDNVFPTVRPAVKHKDKVTYM